jgi:hypothetical protein
MGAESHEVNRGQIPFSAGQKMGTDRDLSRFSAGQKKGSDPGYDFFPLNKIQLVMSVMRL